VGHLSLLKFSIGNSLGLTNVLSLGKPRKAYPNRSLNSGRPPIKVGT